MGIFRTVHLIVMVLMAAFSLLIIVGYIAAELRDYPYYRGLSPRATTIGLVLLLTFLSSIPSIALNISLLGARLNEVKNRKMFSLLTKGYLLHGLVLISAGLMSLIILQKNLWRFYQLYQEVHFELGSDQYWFLSSHFFYILFPVVYGIIELGDGLKISKNRL